MFIVVIMISYLAILSQIPLLVLNSKGNWAESASYKVLFLKDRIICHTFCFCTLSLCVVLEPWSKPKSCCVPGFCPFWPLLMKKDEFRKKKLKTACRFFLKSGFTSNSEKKKSSIASCSSQVGPHRMSSENSTALLLWDYPKAIALAWKFVWRHFGFVSCFLIVFSWSLL